MEWPMAALVPFFPPSVWMVIWFYLVLLYFCCYGERGSFLFSAKLLLETPLEPQCVGVGSTADVSSDAAEKKHSSLW